MENNRASAAGGATIQQRTRMRQYEGTALTGWGAAGEGGELWEHWPCPC